jgi:hypothetical protein
LRLRRRHRLCNRGRPFNQRASPSTRRDFKYLITVTEHDPSDDPSIECRKKLAFPRIELRGMNQLYSARCPDGSAGMGNGLIQVHVHSAWEGRAFNASASAIAGKPIHGPAIIQYDQRRRYQAVKVPSDREDEAHQYWADMLADWKQDLDLISCGRHWWFVQLNSGSIAEGRLMMMKMKFVG